MKKFIFLIFIGATFLNCSKDDNSSDESLVLYNQTYCLDSWGYTDDDKELADKIIEYFNTVNIEIYSVKIDNKGTQQVCNACSCLSGKRFIAKVNIHDLDSIKEYGFQEYN